MFRSSDVTALSKYGIGLTRRVAGRSLPGLAVALAILITASTCRGQEGGPSPAQLSFDRAVADFEAGRIEESARGFDEVLRLVPTVAPQLWQRGIALYYAERWDDCRAQFELHRTVNPNDVENAVWHYICVARAESPEDARRQLLPVGPDPRAPMAEIYQMFRGALDPDAVLSTADSLRSEFYAHLYVGLFYEANGDVDQARNHIETAARAEYRAAGGYMHMVAGVHNAVMFQTLAPQQ